MRCFCCVPKNNIETVLAWNTEIMSERKRIQEGDYVVFKRDDHSKVFQICKKKHIFFEKAKIAGEQLIGQHYGSQFTVEKGQLIPVIVTKTSINVAIAREEDGMSGKDNRGLVGSEENQKLSHEEIIKMKEEGVCGQAIVEKLIEQSETFKTKTEFSQEKYIKKKSKRHILEFRVLEPNAHHLLDVFKQSPMKICNLRADSLSQLLCYGSVMAGATIAVVESCHGLVLGSVMERMGGLGKVIHLFPGNDMNRHVVSYFNFSEEHMQILYEFPLNKLAELEYSTDNTRVCSENLPLCTEVTEKTEKPKVLEDCDSAVEQDDEKKMETECVDIADDVVKNRSPADSKKEADTSRNGSTKEDIAMKKADEAMDEDGGVQEEEGRKRKAQELKEADKESRKQIKTERSNKAAEILKGRLIDSLIIASKYHPATLLQRLLPYVPPSRPVVVFSQHKEPLVECYNLVQEKNLGIQRRLSETWYREYQVLPSRTHPQMSMSGTGGYLLTFTTVTDS